MVEVVRVVHLTSVHPRDDIRVFRKECTSLARLGFDVHLIVADGGGQAVTDGVHVHDVGVVVGRLRRMLIVPWRVLRAARQLRGRVYHFHDPELIPIALVLRRSAHVIYDSHEDLPRAVLSKDWISRPLRRLVAALVEGIENAAARRFAAVVGATPHIARRFAASARRAVPINNYPLSTELIEGNAARPSARVICYIGVLSRQRGTLDMIRAMEHVDARLILAGAFSDARLEMEARALPAWGRVDYRGEVSRAETRTIMAHASAGLLVFHPEPNHVEAQPNKLFEYMSASLPVLASDFPLWREIVEGNGAGFCTTPGDAVSIGRAIDQILGDPDAARAMGARGLDAVRTKYQWATEEAKLQRLYLGLVAQGAEPGGRT